MHRGSISLIFICPTSATGPATNQGSENSHKMSGFVNWDDGGRRESRKEAKRPKKKGRREEGGREGGRRKMNE